MKKLVIGALALLFFATSCSYRVYTVDSLRANYTLGMQTPEELEAKEGVQIYLSEQEVPGNYHIIAFAESRPILPVAIQPQQLKNFYKQAVLKAKELGGDGIIVSSVGQFKVIKHSGATVRQAPVRRPPVVRDNPEPRQETIRKEDKPAQTAPATNAPRRSARDLFKVPARTSDSPATSSTTESKTAKSTTTTKAPITTNAPAKTPTTASTAAASAAATAAKPAAKATTNAPAKKAAEPAAAKPVASAAERAAIFNDNTLQWFTSGYVYRAKEQEQVEIIETMNNEIRDNIAICQTRSEAEFIMTKIDQLEKYNKALPVPSGTQSNKIKGYRNALEKILGMGEEKPENKSGAIDNAVQSVKGFFGNLKKNW